jgi:uncharacterized protein (TIGR02569 family)
MRIGPPPQVLEAFGLAGTAPAPLAGGQQRSWRAGDAVLKPCDDAAEAEWLGGVLSTLREDGFRIARPIRSREGGYVADGWCAAAFVAGDPRIAGRWDEAIGACRAFHRAVAHVSVPPGILRHDNPYHHSDRIAWGEEPHRGLGGVVEPLFAHWRPLVAPTQFIHGDPGEGNLLFADGLAPAVIDIPPYQRPADYAVAMLLSDGVAWSRAPVSLLAAETATPQFDQLLLRAVLFRLCVAQVIQRNAEAAARRLAAYTPVIDAVARWPSRQT